ncbi:uncharacterized protein N0V89_005272 [Didymosphaeria variabile]|uniref:Uncharacterized protein n=1 Tax=Didymosphaeria variabile TaxID=1932322 RepID=A0A9W9CB22_9PLEO|nr:uncharacterized protein N0V89_005272 [Didymosphaeria variabile]KAJ4353542.1 hypothetical protein N0V89_005272 [Didymosphaeria variabile]
MAGRNVPTATAYAVPSKITEDINNYLALRYKDHKDGTLKKAIARVHKKLIDRSMALGDSLQSSTRNELDSLICADISTSAGYLRYRQQLVRHRLANKLGAGLASKLGAGLSSMYLLKGGPDITRTNRRSIRSAIEVRNTTRAFLRMPIPAELILNVAEMMEDDVELSSFRAACSFHKDLIDGTPSLRDRLANRVQDSCDEFLLRVHMDWFRKEAIKELQCLTQGVVPRYLMCSFCCDRHPTSDFATKAYAKDALQRVCKAPTAAMYVCPHRSLSFQEIFMQRRELAIRMVVNRSTSERISLCSEPGCGRHLVIGPFRTYRGHVLKDDFALVRTTDLKNGDVERGDLENSNVPTDDTFGLDHTVALDVNKLYVPSEHDNDEPRDQSKEAKWARATLVRADAYICSHLRTSSTFVYTVIQDRINLELYGRNFGSLANLPSAELLCPESGCGTKIGLYCQHDSTSGPIEKQYHLRLIVREKAFSLRMMTDKDWLRRTRASERYNKLAASAGEGQDKVGTIPGSLDLQT